MSSLKKKQKTIEDYRKDIYTLKNKLKERQTHLEDLRQKYTDLDIFTDQSYTYHMKLKILQCYLQEIKQKMHQFSKHQAYQCYALNFSMLAFLKSCQIVSITPQMVFRAIDTQYKYQVSWLDFASFLKQSLKMDSQLTNPFLLALDPQQNGIISLERYQFFLECFLARTQQFLNLDDLQMGQGTVIVSKSKQNPLGFMNNLLSDNNQQNKNKIIHNRAQIAQPQKKKQFNVLMQSMQKVTRLILQRNIDLRSIWTNSNQLNIATFSYGLLKKLGNTTGNIKDDKNPNSNNNNSANLKSNIDILDCFACYCKCDPLKTGCLQKKIAIANFEQKIQDFTHFEKGSVKIKKN